MINYREVYSTDKGYSRPEKLRDKRKSLKLPPGIKNDGIVRIRKESKGRGGKMVTAIYGISLPEVELKDFSKRLKQKCGTGGQTKDGVILIQGDKTAELSKILQEEGYQVKQAGA